MQPSAHTHDTASFAFLVAVGEFSLWVALIMAGWAAAASVAGGALRRADLVQSGARAAYATFLFTLLATVGFWSALLAHDFSIGFVALNTSEDLPKVYALAALWAGPAGSMLLWSLILSMYTVMVLFANRRSGRSVMPWVTATLSVITAFLLVAVLFGANPYERLEWSPPDGRGMDPRLQHPGMLIHPPLLYLGLVATAVPFAFAVGALVTRRVGTAWLVTVRRWGMVSWFFLTLGILTGMWWVYRESGWAGDRAWELVGNPSLLPWLTGTAFLHSLMIQEKRGLLRRWNIVLLMSTFLLTLLATMVAGSGSIASVHAIAPPPLLSWFAGFLLVAAAVSVWLVRNRHVEWRARAELESLVSRETTVVYGNLLLVGIAFAILWGALLPSISEWVRGETMTVGAPYFAWVIAPLALLLLALAGVGTLLAWRMTSMAALRSQFTWPVLAGLALAVFLLVLGIRDGYTLISFLLAGFVTGAIVQEFLAGVGARRRLYAEGAGNASLRIIARNRRRYGGYVAHLGLVLLVCAFAGLGFRKEVTAQVKTGETITAIDPYGRSWMFTSQGISRAETPDRRILSAAFAVTRDGERLGILSSEQRQHFGMGTEQVFDPSAIAAVQSSPAQDLFLLFTGSRDLDTASVTISFNPLVWWVWVGGIVLACGGLIMMWPPGYRREPRGRRVRTPSMRDAAPRGVSS